MRVMVDVEKGCLTFNISKPNKNYIPFSEIFTGKEFLAKTPEMCINLLVEKPFKLQIQHLRKFGRRFNGFLKFNFRNFFGQFKSVFKFLEINLKQQKNFPNY